MAANFMRWDTESRLKSNDVTIQSVDLETAAELAKHDENEQVLNFDSVALRQQLDSKNYDPRSGPFSMARNEEVFRAILYLMDAEKKKRPNVVQNYKAMRWYYARKQAYWKWCLGSACFLYIVVSITETPAFDNLADAIGKQWYEVLLEIFCDIIFAMDIWMQANGKGFRSTFNNRWTQAFCLFLAFDFIGIIWQGLRLLMVTGIVRAFPIVYYSKRARNAMINYSKTLPAVLMWICLELFVVILYACLGVVLYGHIDRGGLSNQSAMQTFRNAFLSLYSLSLTVNDPDVYLPYYRLAFSNIAVFASFMIVSYFMIHNIILSRIFQIYSTKLKDTAIKRRENRHCALFLAFEALDQQREGALPKELLIYVLRRLRPRYSEHKIETLMRHSSRRALDVYNFNQFELLMAALDDRVTKIRQTKFYATWAQKALDAANVAHLLIVVGSIVDYWTFFYSAGFWTMILFFRVVFTADVCYRIRRTGGFKYFLKDTFNILNLTAIVFTFIAVISFIHSIGENHGRLHLDPYNRSKKVASLAILLASCCDIGRIFNRVPEYAALVTVFTKLLPAFIGQTTVVFTLMHVFCYVGMYVFGGTIYPEHPMWADRGFPGNLYYLLNFNTYKEGMVTLFMLLIVNNWNIISANFVQVTSGSSYLYFMAFQIAVVIIGLNCVTSFFIGSLSNKLEEELQSQHQERRKEKEEQRQQRREARRGVTPPRVRFKVERKISSDDLMLAQEDPVANSDYRALLDAMDRAHGEQTAYSWIRDDQDAEGIPQIIQRSPTFVEIVDRYGGELKIMNLVQGVFREENQRRREREENGAVEPTAPFIVVQHTLRNKPGAVSVTIYFLLEAPQLIAYCSVVEAVVPPMVPVRGEQVARVDTDADKRQPTSTG